MFGDQAITTRVMQQPVFMTEGRSRDTGRSGGLQQAAEIVRMYAITPAITCFLYEVAARELKSGTVEPGALLFGAGKPDHYRRRLGKRAEVGCVVVECGPCMA